MRPGQEKPHAGGHGASDAIASMGMLYGKREATRSGKGWQSPRLPTNWRERLPDPADYYARNVANLGKQNGEGWAQGRCPLHEDRHESLSVNLAGIRGGWRCFTGCGKGDMVSFQMRLKGCGFVDAVRDLMRLRP